MSGFLKVVVGGLILVAVWPLIGWAILIAAIGLGII